MNKLKQLMYDVAYINLINNLGELLKIYGLKEDEVHKLKRKIHLLIEESLK